MIFYSKESKPFGGLSHSQLIEKEDNKKLWRFLMSKKKLIFWNISVLEGLSGKCNYTFGNNSPKKDFFLILGTKVDSNNDQQISNKRYLHLFLLIYY